VGDGGGSIEDIPGLPVGETWDEDGAGVILGTTIMVGSMLMASVSGARSSSSNIAQTSSKIKLALQELRAPAKLAPKLTSHQASVEYMKASLECPYHSPDN
jgi:hypothetical protein